MTQPPPYQGGYPPPPDSQGGFGQQPPQGGPPPGGGFPGGPPPPPGSPPPPGGQVPGGPPPSGFPPPGQPTPPQKGGGGKVLAIVGGIGVVVLVLIIGVGFFLVRGLSGGDDGGGGDSNADSADDGGDTQAAEVGDCTNEMAETNEYTDTDASDVVTVSCDSDDAYFEIVEREDNPSTTDEEEVANEVCTGTMATDYIYQHRGSDLEWLICLDPIDIETAEWGAIPGEVGQCWSENDTYFEIVECDDSSARFEIVFAEENPSTSASSGDEASEELCPQDATAYWSDPEEPPFDWYVCTVDV